MLRIDTRTILLATVVLTFVSGCNVAKPNLFHPGHVNYQRARATMHDPYGDQDAGPEVLGGRPPQYETQRSQAERSQWFLNPRGG